MTGIAKTLSPAVFPKMFTMVQPILTHIAREVFIEVWLEHKLNN